MSVSATTSTIAGRAAWTVQQLPGAEHVSVFATGDSFGSDDPATGERVATLASSTAQDVDRARQQGVDGLHEFTETKHLNLDGNPTLW